MGAEGARARAGREVSGLNCNTGCMAFKEKGHLSLVTAAKPASGGGVFGAHATPPARDEARLGECRGKGREGDAKKLLHVVFLKGVM